MWIDVVGNGCWRGLSGLMAEATQRLDLELVLGALAMAIELRPIARTAIYFL